MLVRDVQQHIIGNIENGVFLKQVAGSKHFLRNPEPAIAVDAEAFDTVINRHTYVIQVIDRETTTRYQIKTDLFAQQKAELNRGFGRQYFVPLRLWDNLVEEVT